MISIKRRKSCFPSQPHSGARGRVPSPHLDTSQVLIHIRLLLFFTFTLFKNKGIVY